MTRSSAFGQWPFYGILAIVILFLLQTLRQAGAYRVGLREFAIAYNKFNYQMTTFKQQQRPPVIEANADMEMMQYVRNNLDRYRQILEAFEPIRDVIIEPSGIGTAAYREKIHKLTVLLLGSPP
jgi:hypothetical protein